MSDFSVALDRLRSNKLNREFRGENLRKVKATRDRLQDSAFDPGDTVRDKETREHGRVIKTAFSRINLPAAR